MARPQMDANAQMNATMNETLNISGALLVKLFGRRETEVKRFQQRAERCAIWACCAPCWVRPSL